jgi:hypothetical protein
MKFYHDSKTTLLLSAAILGSLLVAVPAAIAFTPLPNLVWATGPTAKNSSQSINFIGNDGTTLFVADGSNNMTNGTVSVNYVGTNVNDTFVLYGPRNATSTDSFVATDSAGNASFYVWTGTSGISSFALSSGKSTNFYLWDTLTASKMVTGGPNSTTFAITGGPESVVYATGNCTDWVNGTSDYIAANTWSANLTGRVNDSLGSGYKTIIDSTYGIPATCSQFGAIDPALNSTNFTPNNSVFSINLGTGSSVELGTYFGSNDTVNLLF